MEKTGLKSLFLSFYLGIMLDQAKDLYADYADNN